MTELIKGDYETLKEDVESIITEAVFNSREDLYKGYWEVGQRIRAYQRGNVTRILQDLSLDLNKSERTLWYAVQFYDTFPNYEKVNQLEEQKNLSWNKIINKYLPDGEKPKKEHYYQCPKCGHKGIQNEFKH